ncbi:Unknown protein, partial [Striga hermonthica]
QPGPPEPGQRPPPQGEEQMLTITRGEMQRMIAEAVAAKIKQTPVEQPRVEQPRIEQARIEQPQNEQQPPEREQQAQSHERQNRRVDEEEDFDGFSSSFLNQFASVKAQEKSYLTLIGMQQKEGESLRDYVARYTRACVDVPSAIEEIKSGGLTRGLLPGLCRNSLAKRPGRTFDEVLGRCAKYMNVEEAEADFLQAAKQKTEPQDEKKDKKLVATTERKGSPRAEREGRSKGWRTAQYTPLSASHARILEVIEREIRDDVVRWPRMRKDGPTKPKSNLYCRFHKDYGHNTDKCRHLKNEIERLIKAGHLKEFVYKDRERTSRRRERSKSPRKRARTPDKEELPKKRGVIHMIFGGPTDGDSNRARKAYARGHHGKTEVQQVEEDGPMMNFGPADVGAVERPHNDALMITAQISGYEVQRIFVDTGSSVNVIFFDCLKRMELDIELSPLHTSLFGFNGSEVAPLGETTLAIVLGEGDLRKVKMVRFVVVDVESAYNVILGRPALNAFQAVVSTYHMKLKFP